MSLDLIISLFFIVVAFIAVIFMFNLKKTDLLKFKKYLIASSIVFFSGTIFVLLITVFKGPIAIPFIVISECLITFVFAMSVFTMIKISSQIMDIRKEIDEKNT